MRSWLACILVFLVSASMLAQTAGTQTTTTTTKTTTSTKPKAKTAAKKPAAKRPTTASELQTLRDAVSAQQQQIQMLRNELQQRDAAMQQIQQQLNTLQTTTQQVQSTAQTAATCCDTNTSAVAGLKSDLATTQASATATATALTADEKRIKDLENPVAIKYKGITITPGGFIAAQLNWRKANQNLDNFGSFGAIPFAGTTNDKLTEFRLTGRYSRLSLLAQGKTSAFDFQAYYEMDFEGAAGTANENQTNSFQPRIREAWANLDMHNGLSFSGGQEWSLLTANRTGVGPRGLMLPAAIDASLVLGFHYTRAGMFRLTKEWDLANKKKVYFGVAVESPQTISTGSTPTGFTIYGLQSSPGQPTASAPNGTFAAGISVNPAPDIIGKIAIEPGWGHFEIAGIARFFRDRVALTANSGPNVGSNHTSDGGGASFNAVLPVVPKKVDIVLATLGGRGVGRHVGVSDVTIRPDGTLVPLMVWSGYGGVEMHPTPKFDFNVYVGDVYTQRSPYYTSTGVLPAGVGYALISQDLRGCTFEQLGTTGFGCTASNKNNYEISPGFWYRFYRGPAGTVQFGTFYEYLYRNTWGGRIGGTTAAPIFGPINTNESVIMSSFRWYFP